MDEIDIDSDTKISFPENVTACGGAPSLHDLQLDQLPTDKFTTITDPVKVFRLGRNFFKNSS